jgi:hypothetical protein
MPALPSVPNVLRIDRFFSMAGGKLAKVHAHGKYVGAPLSNAEAAAVAGLVRASFAGNLAGLMSSAYSLVDTVVTDLTSPTAGVGSDTTVVPGTLTGEPAPQDACVLNSLEIGRRFRGGHPRQYWPFGESADMADPTTWGSVFIGTCSTKLGLDAAAWQAAINTVRSGAEAVSVSYYDGFTVHTGTTGRARNVSTVRLVPLVDPVVSEIVREIIATQRKRLLRA